MADISEEDRNTDTDSVRLIGQSPTEAPRHQFIYRESPLSSGFASCIKVSPNGLQLLLLSLTHLSEFVNGPPKGKHFRLFLFISFFFKCRTIKVMYCNRSKRTFLSVSSPEIKVLRTRVAEKQNQSVSFIWYYDDDNDLYTTAGKVHII